MLGLALAGCSGGGGVSTLAGGDDYRVLGALAELPAAAGTADGAFIFTGDLASASELAGLERPTDPGDDAVLEWLSDLTGGPTSADSPGVYVPLPPTLDGSGGLPAAEADELLGWSVVDVDAFAAAQSPPDDFTVVAGDFDDETLSGSLSEVGDGVVTDREGEDREVDLSNPGLLGPEGAPTRLAQSNGRIAFAGDTAAVSSWVEGPEESLADDEAFGSVAAALDAGEAYSAVLTRAPSAGGALGGQQTEEGAARLAERLPEAPYDVVGLGWGKDDDGATVAAAYHFGSDTDAEEAVEPLRTLYTSESSAATGEAFDAYVTVDDVTTDGPVVVVTTRPAPDAPIDLLFQALQRGDTLFVSR